MHQLIPGATNYKSSNGVITSESCIDHLCTNREHFTFASSDQDLTVATRTVLKYEIPQQIIH